MGEMEPSSSESEGDPDEYAPPSPLSDEMDVPQPPDTVPSTLYGVHHLIFYSFIISTALDGLLHLFLPLVTNAQITTLPTLLRSTGIYSLTLSILSVGVIHSYGDLDLLSLFLFAAAFHCLASLSNLAFAVSAYGIRMVQAYEWLSMLFYVPLLLVLGMSQGRYVVNRVLVETG